MNAAPCRVIVGQTGVKVGQVRVIVGQIGATVG